MPMAAHVADGMHRGVHGVPYHAESTLKELVMKASGDLILPTERRRIAFYLLRSHLSGHRYTP